MKPAVFKNHHSNTVLQIDRDEQKVTYVAYVDGVVDVHKLPHKEFDREYQFHLADYPVKRAAELYLKPLTTAIQVTERASKHLQSIIHHEEKTMSTIESSTAEGAKNTKETVKASLKTGTKAGKAPAAPKKEAAKPAVKGGAKKIEKAAKPAAKPAPAKKAAAKKEAPKKAEGKKRGFDESAKLTVLVKENPKREGTDSYERFEAYFKAKTVGDAYAAGITTADLHWDSNHEYIKIG